MASITWSDVENLDASLSAVTAAWQASVLAYVNPLHDVTLWPSGEADPGLYLARVYLAAHLGTLALPGAGGSGGAVQSESVGGLSVTYAVATSPDKLGETAHGRLYLGVIRGLAGARLPRAF